MQMAAKHWPKQCETASDARAGRVRRELPSDWSCASRPGCAATTPSTTASTGVTRAASMSAGPPRGRLKISAHTTPPCRAGPPTSRGCLQAPALPALLRQWGGCPSGNLFERGPSTHAGRLPSVGANRPKALSCLVLSLSHEAFYALRAGVSARSGEAESCGLEFGIPGPKA